MAVNPVQSTKQLLIDKANTRIVAYVGIAAFVLVFSLVATKTLVSQAGYQNHVISKKQAAVDQLKEDKIAAQKLKTAYSAFTGTAQNVIGGNSNGTGSQDGNNAKIILDALPSGYDFPGLTTSLEALLTNKGVTLDSISGTDDEVAQSATPASPTPQAIPIPFSVSVEGDYTGIQNTIKAFENSIRPMQIQTMDLSGSQGKLTLTITAQTYYQPATSLNISKVVVK